MTTREIEVLWGDGATWVALREEGRLAEVWVERPQAIGAVGQVFRGRVVRVVPGMNAAFVEFGGARAGLLQVSGRGEKDARRIGDLVNTGDDVVVQVTREGVGEKGPRLTLEPSLAGRTVVLLPRSAGVAVSQRIEDKQTRERLRAVLARAVPEGMGAIARTAAVDADDDAIEREVAALSLRWQTALATPGRNLLLDGGPAIAERVLQDHLTAATTVHVDDTCDPDSVRDMAALCGGESIRSVARDEAGRRFATLKKEIDVALRPRVELANGGWIHVSESEALTAVDVNTGKFLGARSFEETAVETNVLAATEVARQVRLRAIAGMLVVDFLSMDDAAGRERVLATLRAAFSGHRTPAKVGTFSEFGLVEINRKRSRPSLRQTLCASCAACEGTGSVWRTTGGEE